MTLKPLCGGGAKYCATIFIIFEEEGRGAKCQIVGQNPGVGSSGALEQHFLRFNFAREMFIRNIFNKTVN